MLALVVLAVSLPASHVAAPRPNVDASNAPGPQNEPSIAIDPRNPNVLLAGSNSFSEATDRVYTSTDGGTTWRSRPGPPLVPGRRCGAADPGVAIDQGGRQYFSFLQCTGSETSEIAVATRPGPDGRWKTVLVPGSAQGDKPAIAVGNGRAYVVWIAHLRDGLRLVLLSRSVDGGRRWSRPVSVNDAQGIVFYPSVAVGAQGAVEVAWSDIDGVELDRSTDLGRHFGRDRQVASIPLASACAFRIPAQPTICVWPDPVVTADRSRGRVYVTWSAMGSNGALDVFARRAGGSPHRVNPPDGRTPSDQFWPVPAVDQSTGRLWVCFYDTRADRRRTKSVYSCTASKDGGVTWASPVAAAEVPSDEAQAGAAKGEHGREYGDYEGLAVSAGIAHPIWTDSRQLRTHREEIYTTRLAAADLRRSPAGGEREQEGDPVPALGLAGVRASETSPDAAAAEAPRHERDLRPSVDF